ncbi:MAG: hypothetical protein Q9218_006222, partial [Villophora microphyllina]
HLNARNALLLERLHRNAEAKAAVREIYVNWAPGVIPRHDHEGGKVLMERFVELVPRLVGLKVFIWDAQCAILPRLLTALQHPHLQNCTLHTTCPFRTDVVNSLRTLQNNHHLLSLDLTITDTQFTAKTALRKLLPTSPSLRNLAISVVKDSGPFPGNFALCVPGMSLPPLKILKLQHMKLAEYGDPGWEECMVWEGLEQLECTEVGFLPTLSGPLQQGLLSLTVHHSAAWNSEQRFQLCEFIENASRLENLSVTEATELIIRGRDYESRAPYLKSLRFHEYQEFDKFMDIDRFVLSCRHIERIAKVCPQLHTFGIDLKVGSEWPYETFQTIADSLWFIVHLEFYIELPDLQRLLPHGQSPDRSVVNLKNVRHIWASLWRGITQARERRNHLICLPRLQTLKIYEGSFRLQQNLRPGILRNERREEAIFEARLSERDDLAAKGHADVVCLELEGLQEKYGKGPLASQEQTDLMQDMISRAYEGSARQRKSVLDGKQVHLRPLRTKLLAMTEGQLG